MPIYPYICGSCGHTEDVQLPMKRGGESRSCPVCRGIMDTDWSRKSFRVHDDPEACMADVDRQQELRAAGRQVERPILSRSLARVPGLRKIRGRDGKRYAFFPTKQARRKALNSIGMTDAE